MADTGLQSSALKPSNRAASIRAYAHRVSYAYGVIEARADLAVVYMSDATMHATEPTAFPLFRLGAPG